MKTLDKMFLLSQYLLSTQIQFALALLVALCACSSANHHPAPKPSSHQANGPLEEGAFEQMAEQCCKTAFPLGLHLAAKDGQETEAMIRILTDDQDVDAIILLADATYDVIDAKTYEEISTRSQSGLGLSSVGATFKAVDFAVKLKNATFPLRSDAVNHRTLPESKALTLKPTDVKIYPSAPPRVSMHDLAPEGTVVYRGMANIDSTDLKTFLEKGISAPFWAPHSRALRVVDRPDHARTTIWEHQLDSQGSIFVSTSKSLGTATRYAGPKDNGAFVFAISLPRDKGIDVNRVLGHNSLHHVDAEIAVIGKVPADSIQGMYTVRNGVLGPYIDLKPRSEDLSSGFVGLKNSLQASPDDSGFSLEYQ